MNRRQKRLTTIENLSSIENLEYEGKKNSAIILIISTELPRERSERGGAPLLREIGNLWKKENLVMT